MTPWAKAKFDTEKPGYGPRGAPGGNDPILECTPAGIPRILFYPTAHEIVQTPDRMFMFFEREHAWRQIWTDGRPLPKVPEDADPAWNGYAIGHWEGNTFLVESTGYDERTWFDRMGDPRSAQGVLVERWTRTDYDTLELQMTLTDPKAYVRPWVGDKQIFKRQKFALYEEHCVPSEEQFFQQHQRNVALGSAKNVK